MEVGHPILVSTAAAPSFPFIVEPSVYIFTVSFAFLTSLDSYLLVAMLIQRGVLLVSSSNGLCTATEIFSIVLGSRWNICIMSFSGALCLFDLLFMLALTSLCSRCSGGSMARRTAALWHCFSTSSSARIV